MHKNYELGKQVITNIIHKRTHQTSKTNNSLSITLNLKHPTSSLKITQTPLTQTNVVYKFTYLFRDCFMDIT